MNLKKASFGLYILIILLLFGYGAYYELYNRQFDNFVDKDIVVTRVDKVTHRDRVAYTIVDSENMAYFFSSAEGSSILNTIKYRNEMIELSIRYNTRNNEISEVSDSFEINKRIIVNREYIIISLIMGVVVIIYFLLKTAIENEWFFRRNRSDMK